MLGCEDCLDVTFLVEPSLDHSKRLESVLVNT